MSNLAVVYLGFGSGSISGKKKDINNNFFFGLGTTPGLSQGQTQVSPYLTQWKPGLSLGQTSFSVGQTWG